MTDIDKIPAEVLDALRERGWSEEGIAEMPPWKMFEQYCISRGISGNGTLWRIVTELSKLENQE